MAIDEAAMQRLLDKEAIREALALYTRGIDRHDDAIMAQAYHPDAADDHGNYIGDALGFIRHAREGHSRNWVIHQHYTSNETIDLDGDSAHVESYFLAVLRRADGIVDIVGGRYVDRFERRDGRWAMSDRACLVEWNSELPAPANNLPTDLFLGGRWDREDLSYRRPFRIDRPAREIGY